MKPENHLQSLTSDTSLISEAAEKTSGDTSVPACPPWTVDDLLVHLSQIWTFVARSTKADQAVDRASIERPEGSANDWHRASSQELLEALGLRNPTDKTWAFDLPDATVAFWIRRMCHEASIHRHDIQIAANNVQPVEHAVAVDGINEIFDYMVPRRKPTDFAGNGQTLHLHVTEPGSNSGEAANAAANAADNEADNAAGEWFITRTPDGIAVENKHAKADVAARGTASDLLLMLWGRVAPSELEVFGDMSLLTEWQQKMAI